MKNYQQFCGLARALDYVGQRWTLLIVRELLAGPRRFTDLRAGLPRIPSNLLADRLRDMCEDGLVQQRDLPPPAASTVYELTDAGAELRDVVDALIRWGGRWMQTGRGGDDFRGEWLILALGALGAGEALKREVVLRIESGDESVVVAMGRGRVRAADSDADPLVTVRGEPETILGLAAGALSSTQALTRLRVEPRTRDNLRLLKKAFAGDLHRQQQS